jgi:hypothetical protein
MTEGSPTMKGSGVAADSSTACIVLFRLYENRACIGNPTWGVLEATEVETLHCVANPRAIYTALSFDPAFILNAFTTA